MKESMLGYAIDALSINECVDSVMATINQNRKCAWLACLNPHSYVVSLNDSVFMAALKNADWLIPDGAGIVFASEILGGAIRQRVTGADIFYGVLKRMNAVGGLSVFFLGSTEKTLMLISEKMSLDYPNIRIAGVYSPPFKSNYSQSENDAMIGAINGSHTDVLWVGMTAPKQEKWIYENRSRLNVRFVCAVGAVFDFYSGNVKRAHPVFQRLGLEWLPRLFQQPGKLWRRNFISTPLFLWILLKAKFFLRKLR